MNDREGEREKLEVGCIVQMVKEYSEVIPSNSKMCLITLRCHPREMSDGDILQGTFHAEPVGLVLDIDHHYDVVKIMVDNCIGWVRKKKLTKVG